MKIVYDGFVLFPDFGGGFTSVYNMSKLFNLYTLCAIFLCVNYLDNTGLNIHCNLRIYHQGNTNKN